MSEAIASKEERLVRYNANIAAADKDPQLSPETGKPLSKVNTIRFGAGFLLFGVLWMSGLGIVSAVLLPMHYKTIEGADPDALVGIVNAFTAVASLVANLMFGNFSDRSRSRFGRRTPWIVFGAVLGGVTLFLTGTTHNAVLLTIFYCACMFGLNCMIAPLVAVLSDRVPSGIRGTMSAFYGAGSTIGAPIGTMIGAFFIENLTAGFAVAGVLMFLGGLVAVIILPKEQSADFLPKEEGLLQGRPRILPSAEVRWRPRLLQGFRRPFLHDHELPDDQRLPALHHPELHWSVRQGIRCHRVRRFHDHDGHVSGRLLHLRPGFRFHRPS